MRRLTPRQEQILAFLAEFIDDKGYPPSYRQIAQACHISSTSVVDYNLEVLEREGYLRRDREISRGLELTEHSQRRSRVTRIPVLGQIAAGQPIAQPDAPSLANAEEFIEISDSTTNGRPDVYAVRVKGTSMIDALINDGDIVLLQHTNVAENGEMAAVWLKQEKETTLKKFYLEGPRVRLQPANSQMDPIYVDADNVEIQGRVVGVIRAC
ncbi:MAG TPA: transcriptional repressor LexA [Dehalococcoidia bacterium]|nr:transcriptional repressor LexA [Dehalococcoidia bacterium]